MALAGSTGFGWWHWLAPAALALVAPWDLAIAMANGSGNGLVRSYHVNP